MADSQHWRNMPDQGFVIHRPSIFDDGQRKTEAVLYHKKARFEELGYECNLHLDYQLQVPRRVE
jgi:twinkle protein